MKKFLTLIAVCVALTASAQTKVTKDSNGNYHAVTAIVKPAVKVGTFTDKKGVVYPVFKSANNKLFYNKISKSGNLYKVYIKV